MSAPAQTGVVRIALNSSEKSPCRSNPISRSRPDAPRPAKLAVTSPGGLQSSKRDTLLQRSAAECPAQYYFLDTMPTYLSRVWVTQGVWTPAIFQSNSRFFQALAQWPGIRANEFSRGTGPRFTSCGSIGHFNLCGRLRACHRCGQQKSGRPTVCVDQRAHVPESRFDKNRTPIDSPLNSPPALGPNEFSRGTGPSSTSEVLACPICLTACSWLDATSHTCKEDSEINTFGLKQRLIV